MMVFLWTARADTVLECPSRVLYAFPPEGPQFDRMVTGSADDGILVEGEGAYPTSMPFEGPYAFPLPWSIS